jgi:hypothetical protein
MLRIPLPPLLLLIACQPPAPVAPGPITLTSPRAPGEVIQAAVRELRTQGFEITASDEIRGVLSARVTRRPADFGTQLKCAAIRGVDIGDRGQTTMTIGLEVRPKGQTAGSDVVLASRARTRVGEPGTPNAIDDEKTCTSSGIVEASVMKAIGG